MPLYDFQCEKCGETFEALLGPMDDYPPCPRCQGLEVIKLPSLFAFQDKTSYIKDRERAIIKRTADYLKDGKIKEAQRFLNKALSYNPSEKIKRLSESFEKRKPPKGGFLIKPEVKILKNKG